MRLDPTRRNGGVAAWLGDAPALGRVIAAAVVVGGGAAVVAIAVRMALAEGATALYGQANVVAGLDAVPAWVRVLAPVAGGVVAGLLVQIFVRSGSPGVADVMEAVALGRGRPRFRAAVAQAAGTVASVLGGGSIGREGPLIQLGAGVGHNAASRIAISGRERRALVAAGTAAGFAAAYNTPLAAVLFVLEVVVGVATVDVLIPVAVATATGTAITRAVVGGGPIYGIRAFELASPAELFAFAVLGIVAALGGVGFMKVLGQGERLFARLGRWPRVARAGVGGVVVGLIAWRLPAVCGNGYEPLRDILDGRMALSALVMLAVAKALATTASVGSGSPGGVFTPTMLLGACLGGAMGQLVRQIAPGSGLVGGYALVGVAATLAATTHAPLMATVLVFELTGDYAIVLPLLLATAIATLLARRLCRDSIYTAELRRRGIPWEGTITERLAHAARARDLMEPSPSFVYAAEPLEQALLAMAAGQGRLLYVVDDGPLRAITLTMAKRWWAGCMRGERLPRGVTAGEYATEITALRPDDTMLEIGEKLWHVEWGELPVVDPGMPQRPIGIVTRKGLLGAFDRELIQRDALTPPGRMRLRGGTEWFELPDGHRLAVIDAPGWLCRSPADLSALRARPGVQVVAVRRDAWGATNWQDVEDVYEVFADDKLLVLASELDLARFTRGPIRRLP